jgi:hypothetical protein
VIADGADLAASGGNDELEVRRRDENRAGANPDHGTGAGCRAIRLT